MKHSYAVELQKDIEKACDHLNRLIQEASVEGMTCEIEFIPFRHVSGRVFDIANVVTKIKPSDLEI